MSFITKCDRCGTKGNPEPNLRPPQGWALTEWRVRTGSGPGTILVKHHFCPNCSEILGVEIPPNAETSADRLVALLEAIVDESVECAMEDR